MPPLSLLIKPASSECNLRCKYCFYHSISKSRSIESFGIMKEDTLELLVKKGLEYADGSCTFAFQGGEPTLTGLNFYRKFIEYQKKYNTKKTQVHNVIQTNGIVIIDEWAEFFAKNNFLVGISLDGFKDIHDMNRVDARNSGSFTRVMNAIGFFNKHKVEYNILTVVNSVTARHIGKVYNFFRKNGFNYLQFIPCLDPINEKPGGHGYSLTPEKYAYFLKTLFDLWYKDFVNGNRISIRYFDNLIGMLMGYPPESCGMTGFCKCYYVVESDGSTYPCDFYVMDQWRLGNIKEMSFQDMQNSDTAVQFLEVSKYIDPECSNCEWFQLCRGGCRRSREPFENGRPVLNYYCPSYKEFFSYAGERMIEIAKKLSV